MGKKNTAGADVRYEMDHRTYEGGELSPEGELFKAVLLLAIQDLQTNGEIREKALAYISSEETDHMFSFQELCKYFRLDPSATRKAIISGKSFRFERRRNKFKSQLLEAA